jgi:hypothetical protein
VQALCEPWIVAIAAVDVMLVAVPWEGQICELLVDELAVDVCGASGIGQQALRDEAQRDILKDSDSWAKGTTASA